jgi:hypothetical protein
MRLWEASGFDVTALGTYLIAGDYRSFCSTTTIIVTDPIDSINLRSTGDNNEEGLDYRIGHWLWT